MLDIAKSSNISPYQFTSNTFKQYYKYFVYR